MKQQLILQFQDTYPFGKVTPYNSENQIIVVKKLRFRNPAERTTLLNKAEFLKLLSSNLNTVGMLGYEQGPDEIELIYEYVPFDFFTLLQKNCDDELSEARSTLAKLTTQLQTLGLRTNIHQGTVGLDSCRRLKYYVSIDDIPDAQFQLGEGDITSNESTYNEPLEDEQRPYTVQKNGPNGMITSEKKRGEEHILSETEDMPACQSRISHQSQSLQRSVSQHRMDDLLQKINVRLLELNSHRRKTTPSRYSYKDLTLPQSECFGSLSNCTQIRADSTASTQIQSSKLSRFEIVREKAPKLKTLAGMPGSRLKYSSSTDNLLGEYEALKAERKQMLERIKAVIQKTDSMLSGYKTRKLSAAEVTLNL